VGSAANALVQIAATKIDNRILAYVFMLLISFAKGKKSKRKSVRLSVRILGVTNLKPEGRDNDSPSLSFEVWMLNLGPSDEQIVVFPTTGTDKTIR